MKVYILGFSNYEGIEIEGIFSTREKAEEAMHYVSWGDKDDVMEYELDLPITGEKYETYYYYSINPNGEYYNHGKTKRYPSEVKECSVQDTHNGVIFQGFGKTEEEAELNCKKLLNPTI